MYLQLDLGDTPVVIRTTYTEQGVLPDGTQTTCAKTLSQVVRGYRHLYVPKQCESGVYRPRKIVLACGDGNWGLTHLRWRGWNRDVARASGIAYANDCLPDCARGHFHDYAVRVRAYRVRRCRYDADRYRYTRLRITYRDGRGPLGRAAETWHGTCVAPIEDL